MNQNEKKKKKTSSFKLIQFTFKTMKLSVETVSAHVPGWCRSTFVSVHSIHFIDLDGTVLRES